MKTCSLVTAAAACAVLLAAPARSHANGLECPSLADLHLSPLEEDVAALLPQAPTLAQPARLQAAIQLLQEHGMSSSDTVNYLIALYCPAVEADTGIGQGERHERVRQFADSATRQALASDDIRDILYEVTLPPEVAAAAEARAGGAGLSVEQWIAKTVEDALR